MLARLVQETMENIFRDIDDELVYINDIGAFSPNWEHHLKLFRTITGEWFYSKPTYM
jgi:hypothetical protein